jgi:alpha-D-ribose 1-methylphosphonate 5-triphosphate synthase subunit PhnH
MPNVKELTFDRVHDTQFIYRQLLDAMAKPGQISSIAAASDKLESSLTAMQAVITCFALTLLDGEVSFAIQMDNKKDLETHIRKQTFSHVEAASEADYVFASGNSGDDSIRALLSEVKTGTLIRPEGGATLFIYVEGLTGELDMDAGAEASAKQTTQGCWTLTGPGIQTTCTLAVQGLSKAWIEERAKVNAEYPVGVDIVLFTENGLITALPRTTTMRGEDV